MRVPTALVVLLLSVHSVAQEIEIAEISIQPCFKVEYTTPFLGPASGYLDRAEPKFSPQMAEISAYVGLGFDSEIAPGDVMLKCAREVAGTIGLNQIANDPEGSSSEFEAGLEQCLRQENPKIYVELAVLMSRNLCKW